MPSAIVAPPGARPGERRARCRLDADEPQLGPERVERDRDAGRQAAAADGDHDRPGPGRQLRRRARGRACPDPRRPADPRTRGRTSRPGRARSRGRRRAPRRSPRPPARRAAPYPRAASTLAIGAPSGTTIVAAMPGLARRPGDRLAVVARARGDDAGAPLVVRQLRDRVVRAADLERARALEVLGLEQHGPADEPRERLRGVAPASRGRRRRAAPAPRGSRRSRPLGAHPPSAPVTACHDRADRRQRVDLAPLDAGHELAEAPASSAIARAHERRGAARPRAPRPRR